MGDHKDRTGKTRIGKFLKSLGDKAAPLVEAALSVASDITGVKQLEVLAEKISGSKELTDFEKTRSLMLIEKDIEELKQVTERWKADMSSDSWLSKNVRPLFLIYLVVATTVLMALDSINDNGFTVKDVWISLLSSLLITVVVAYFGSRGIEKVKKISK